MSVKNKLIAHYLDKSKHSNYQILPSRLRALLNQADVETKTRHEQERLDYICQRIDFSDKTVLDIGGNTGFFVFELLDLGASLITHYEGNKAHSDFVILAAKALDLSEKAKTVNSYFSFDGSYTEKFDVVLLFNVLHHLGDDYGDKRVTIEEAKKACISQLNSLAGNTEKLVFQLGFNWQGDPAHCLFDHGTKQEMIDYVKQGIENYWDVEAIGIAEQFDQTIVYKDLNDTNITRNDSLGEFLNRPIFILKSKSFSI